MRPRHDRKRPPVAIFTDSLDMKLLGHRGFETGRGRVRVAGSTKPSPVAMTGKLGRIDAEQTDAFIAASDRVAIGYIALAYHSRRHIHRYRRCSETITDHRGNANQSSGSYGGSTRQRNNR